MKRILLMILTAVLIQSAAFAQKISGTVSDKNGAKIPFANVVLLQNDSTILSGTITDENGIFNFAETQNANVIKISCIGFADFSKVISETETVINAVLEFSDVNLDEITVSARRPLTQIKNGAMVTTVENSLLSKEGNAEDVLKKIPGVIKNGEEIEVFGRGTPEIYINGRKVQDKNELTQINSENIKNVQVIRNPGAKYSAETNSVIIITTKNAVGEGFSFDVTNDNIFGNYYTQRDKLNMNFRKNKLDIFTNFYHEKRKAKTGVDCQQTNFGDTVWNFYNTNTGNDYLKNCDFSGKGGFNYQINQENSFGAFYQYDYQEYNTYIFTGSNVLTNGNLYDFTKINNDKKSTTNPKNSANFYYSGKAGKLDIDFNFDYMSIKNKSVGAGEEYGKTFGWRDVNTLSKRDNNLIAEKLILAYPVWKGKLNFGNEFSKSKSNETYSNLEGYISDSDVKVRENNNAFFAEYNIDLTENVEIAAGLRYEHIDFDYYVFGEKSAEKKYDEIFPSFSFSAQHGNFYWTLNYTGRTQRPSYYMLGNSMSYVNRYTYHSGNSMLKPSVTNDFGFQVVYKIYYLMGSYSAVKNPILNHSRTYGGDSKITHITVENFDKLNKYQFFIGCQPAVGIWRATANAGIFGQIFKTEYCGKTKKMNNPIAMAQLYNNFTLPKKYIIGLDLDYMSEGSYENVEMNQTFKASFNIQKSFFNDALNVKLSVSDIFNTSAQKVDFYNNDVFLHQDKLFETRLATLTLKYRFNPAKSKYKGTGAGNDEKQRM